MTELDSRRRLTVDVDGERWEETKSLSEATAGDKVFVVDDATGHLAFGDGRHGRQPPQNAVVTVSYRDGGGAEGNTMVSIATRWPPAERRYLVAVSSSGIGVRALSGGTEQPPAQSGEAVSK
jgi:hypothetical protein